MKRIGLLISFTAFVLSALGQGIKFENNLSWEQVKEKAKKEHKYIFMDCFATWCGPCKMMDKNVYAKREVGYKINDQFISVKVQMDRTKYDAISVKSWYSTAGKMMKDYHITAFPTFLFFSPNGRLVHRGIGYQAPQQFIRLAVNATISSAQSVTLLANYIDGEKNYSNMLKLIQIAKDAGEDSLAGEIAKDYKQNYMNRLSEKQLLTKANIDFLINNVKLLSSHDLVFKIANETPEKLNKIYPRLAERLKNYIISKEEIYGQILTEDNKPKVKNPDWNKMAKIIDRKYGKGTAESLILNGKIIFYQWAKDWNKLISSYVTKQERYGLDTSGFGKVGINNFVFEYIFKYL
ncbi:thioredoxin family protein [Arachidicoccus terrestris]|uniref:thioredoxin family protein n=1 Tax=Arachidicoccus terrestris TaxID=2875539 RepID=UPI001CC532EE|nr:thioredoxin family protein [Arachidicoccus terrestris]UAY55753.1 thioredoxin family protein [Arachidicoccus terrestris]